MVDIVCIRLLQKSQIANNIHFAYKYAGTYILFFCLFARENENEKTNIYTIRSLNACLHYLL